MVNYVVGFAFNEEKTRVVLIEKQRPDWQKGKLNGIGGKVKEDESIIMAMEREFLEETGLLIPKDQWERFVKIGDNNHHGSMVHFYRAFVDTINEVKSATDERVMVLTIEGLQHCDMEDVIPNLSWLIPLALDASSYSDDIYFFSRLK